MAANPVKTFAQDPDEILDYTVDWSRYLARYGDRITGVTWDTGGMTKGTTTFAAGIATVWLSAGVAGTTYSIRCKIVTAGGRTAERSFQVLAVLR